MLLFYNCKFMIVVINLTNASLCTEKDCNYSVKNVCGGVYLSMIWMHLNDTNYTSQTMSSGEYLTWYAFSPTVFE